MKTRRYFFSAKSSYAYVSLLLAILVVVPLTIMFGQKPQIIKQEAQTVPQAQPQPLGASGNWNLAFDDEFTGTSLDATKWSVCYTWDCHTGGNGELMVYAPQYATVANGLLTIKAVNQQTCDGGYCAKYGSSLIQTGTPRAGGAKKFTFTYGFAEARLQVPYGTGYFPAFWLLGSQSEIDLMEVFGNKTNFNCGVFLNHYKSHWGCQSHGANTPGSYHTYGVDWQPTHLTFYFDGAVVGTTTDPTQIPPDPAYILLNFAIGANFMPPPDATTVFPAYLNADYVRVWQTSGTSQPTPTVSSGVPTFVCAGSQNGVCVTGTLTPTPMITSLPTTPTVAPTIIAVSTLPSPSVVQTSLVPSTQPTSPPQAGKSGLIASLFALILELINLLLSLIRKIYTP